MSKLKKLFSILFVVGRFYSTPISIISWVIPFVYSLFLGGNVYYGLIALVGIVFIQAGVNSFDDIFDYLKERREIEKGIKNDFDFQKEKCKYLFNGYVNLKQYTIISFSFFFIGITIGIFFLNQYGFELLKIIIPSGILCLLYPLCSYIGLGEIIVGLIYSPLLYLGVNYVMMGCFNLNLITYSISTALLTIGILHNHMLLDYKIDTTGRKITLCRLVKSEKNALYLLITIIIMAYLNLINITRINEYNLIYLLPILSFPQAIKLIKEMKKHIKEQQEEINEKIFKQKFMLAQNLLVIFTILLGLSIILGNIK